MNKFGKALSLIRAFWRFVSKKTHLIGIDELHGSLRPAFSISQNLHQKAKGRWEHLPGAGGRRLDCNAILWNRRKRKTWKKKPALPPLCSPILFYGTQLLAQKGVFGGCFSFSSSICKDRGMHTVLTAKMWSASLTLLGRGWISLSEINVCSFFHLFLL